MLYSVLRSSWITWALGTAVGAVRFWNGPNRVSLIFLGGVAAEIVGLLLALKVLLRLRWLLRRVEGSARHDMDLELVGQFVVALSGSLVGWVILL
jgi:hypothetical protein